MRTVFTILLALACAGFTGAQGLREFKGQLGNELSPDMVHVYQRVYKVMSNAAALPVDPKPASGSVVSVGEFIDIRSDGKTQVFLVEPPSGMPYVVVDANRNGKFEPDERTTLTPAGGQPGLTATVQLPIANTRYKSYPVYFHYLKGFRHPKLTEGDRLVEQSVYALAYGSAKIADRTVMLQFPFSPEKEAISPTEGLFGMDLDGDGKIRDQQFSVESQSVSGEEAIFPFAGTYVSTAKIDLPSGEVTLRERQKAEYTRTDLEEGREMPDFSFVDFAGKARKLSDFRGKYVLVDFWGAWCGDCKRETPFHLAAYERFKKRGLEIIGVDSDDKIENARSYVAQNKITWIIATYDSTKELQQKTYKLQEYPSTILVGPDGKVLVLDQHKLQGDALLQTLERVLPR
jgi:peroxiredoxin